MWARGEKVKSLINQILIRSIGIGMFAFIPGMGIGEVAGADWWTGGLISMATTFSVVVIFFGVQLAWNGKLSIEDIEQGFRSAATKAAENNDKIKEALETAADDPIDYSDLGDLDELDDEK
jgi:hypothetical protein